MSEQLCYNLLQQGCHLQILHTVTRQGELLTHIHATQHPLWSFHIILIINNASAIFIFLQVTDINAIAFLESWVVDNRMRALFFNGKETPVVRYLKLAFYHRERISCGYVWMNDPDSVEVIIKYNINRKQETLLMINEDTDSIAASISVSIQCIADLLEMNTKFA